MNSAATAQVVTRPTIGVFDSGFGGLTVLRALLHRLPAADYLYLGDTARLPYGSKSAATVTRYTSAAIQALVARGAGIVVIACNTASALALPHLHNTSPVPLVGVIEPGAQAAHAALSASDAPPATGPVLVLATEGTVASHAYRDACAAHGLSTIEKACPLLVPLVEEGWTDHAVTRQVAEIYLNEALASAEPSAVLLGCTHYPLIRPLLERSTASLFGPVPVIDSAEATAAHVATLLPHAAHSSRSGQHAPQPGPASNPLASRVISGTSVQADPNATAHASGDPSLQFFATDSPQKFQRLGQHFLARPIATVILLDLDA